MRDVGTQIGPLLSDEDLAWAGYDERQSNAFRMAWALVTGIVSPTAEETADMLVASSSGLGWARGQGDPSTYCFDILAPTWLGRWLPEVEELFGNLERFWADRNVQCMAITLRLITTVLGDGSLVFRDTYPPSWRRGKPAHVVGASDDTRRQRESRRRMALLLASGDNPYHNGLDALDRLAHPSRAGFHGYFEGDLSSTRTIAIGPTVRSDYAFFVGAVSLRLLGLAALLLPAARTSINTSPA